MRFAAFFSSKQTQEAKLSQIRGRRQCTGQPPNVTGFVVRVSTLRKPFDLGNMPCSLFALTVEMKLRSLRLRGEDRRRHGGYICFLLPIGPRLSSAECLLERRIALFQFGGFVARGLSCERKGGFSAGTQNRSRV